MIFRREEGKACIRYAHAAFAFPAKPVTHVSEHLSPMCPVSTLCLPSVEWRRFGSGDAELSSSACPRWFIFFTLVTYDRVPLFSDPRACRMLGSLLRRARRRWPFTIDAMVLLPEHLHAIWSLPPGDTAYAMRWG